MSGDLPRFVKISVAAQTLGVSKSILSNWAHSGSIRAIRSPGGMFLFDLSSISGFKVEQQKTSRATILYSRVSSTKQRNDLDRQKRYLQDSFSDQHQGSRIEISDIGSGINFKRPGLLRLLGLVKEGSVRNVVVASRDRLARFGIELIEWFLNQYDTKLVVLDRADCTPEEELGKDLMAIVQVYCCRWNGRRRYKTKTQNDETTDSSQQRTEETIS